MDLQKIYNDNDFENAVVPEGQILVFNSIEDGKVVTRYKDSSGNFGTMAGEGGGESGGEGGAEVILGQVNADGNFQPLAFNGTEASDSGNPEAVENYYGWQGVLPAPNGGIKVYNIGDAEYYKCASVDTANKTWTGYKLVLTDGIHVLETTPTENLSYLMTPPEVGGVYTGTAELCISEVMGYSPEPAIPTNFTSNTSIEGYVIDQSHGGGSYPQAWCVFNQNYTTGDYAWWTGSIDMYDYEEQTAWFSIEVPEAFVPVEIFIMNEVRSPENFKNAIFQGSNNGTEWDDLLEITDSPNETGLKQNFDVSANKAYKFFRMLFTASHTSGVAVQAFQIFKKSSTPARVSVQYL